MTYARITGTGSYLPAKVLTNHDLENIVDTSHEWIVERSGIVQRHIAADHETAASMAVSAAQMALSNACVAAHQVDLIIVATCTGEHIFPSVACEVQHLLGAKKAAAFDITAACAGFVYALSTADQFIRSGQMNNILVIGAEVMSRIVDWQDRTTCVLFGDGAGAVLLSRRDEPGILASDLHADGGLSDILYLKRFEQDAKLQMQGREVFKEAVAQLTQSSRLLLDKAGLTVDDVDWVVPHQANLRIIQLVMSKLKLKSENVIITVDEHANTSAASVPLALHQGIQDGRLQSGQTLLLEAFGGGLAWGGVLLKL